ncbi:hypothetical protein AGLY_017959 [Aphis glycines]|uniref:Uncharacterized protein n=1 Tax=Aphis glycines TaxID=307491 RepID=A0A6G0STH8_APHGL|nr:hypothetical protein AGLY_017959 [Aphis glycines]
MSPTLPRSSQINTRSANINKKSSAPITMVDLLRSITDICSSQIDTLEECKAMNFSQNSKLSELISALISLNLKSLGLDRKIPLSTTRLLTSTTEFNTGLKEFSSNDPTARIASDIKLLNENIHLSNLILPHDPKLFMLGHKRSDKTRPPKVVHSSKELTQSIPANSISTSCNHNLLERQEIHRVYAELENRKKNDEYNVSISYRSRVPLIVLNDGGISGSHSNHPSSSLSKNLSPACIHSSLVGLFFAYDAKLISRKTSSTDCDVLQSSLNNYINWCQALIGLTLNSDRPTFHGRTSSLFSRGQINQVLSHPNFLFNFFSNDPLVRAMRSLNNSNVDIRP